MGLTQLEYLKKYYKFIVETNESFLCRRGRDRGYARLRKIHGNHDFSKVPLVGEHIIDPKGYELKVTNITSTIIIVDNMENPKRSKAIGIDSFFNNNYQLSMKILDLSDVY